jgi:MFS family permease
MIFQIPAGKLTDKIGKKKILIISQTFGILIYAIHILISTFWSLGNETFLFPAMIIIQILFGIAVTTFVPSEAIILTNLDDSRKGVSFGMVSFVRGFGAIPTGIIAAFLIEEVHFIAPFIFTIVGIGIQILFLMKYGNIFDEIEKEEEPELVKKGIIPEITDVGS